MTALNRAPMEQFTCRYCDASFGIAGSLESQEDWEAQDYFDEQVRHHTSRLCRHGRTPQSVLHAPSRTFTPLVIHEGVTRQERRHGLGLPMKVARPEPYTSTKVRKIRRGRKARWNR